MLTKRQVVDQLVDHFGDNILVLSSPGVSSITVFRNKPPLLKLVPSDDNSDLGMSIKNVGKQIVREVKVLKSDYAIITYEFVKKLLQNLHVIQFWLCLLKYYLS